MATGIAYDYSAWFFLVPTPRQQDTARASYPAGFVASEWICENMSSFTGGNLLINVPAPPSRCPPAPYERAMLLAWWLKSRRIKGKVTARRGRRHAPLHPPFGERYPDHIDFHPHTTIRAVDPFARPASTDGDDVHFDH